MRLPARGWHTSGSEGRALDAVRGVTGGHLRPAGAAAEEGGAGAGPRMVAGPGEGAPVAQVCHPGRVGSHVHGSLPRTRI